MKTEQDYQAAADWAEHEMDLSRASGGTLLHGSAAAAHGLGAPGTGHRRPRGAPARQGGRPSIDPDAGPGAHARVRQVRLPAAHSQQLDALAAAQGRRPSDVLREAVGDYLATHRAG